MLFTVSTAVERTTCSKLKLASGSNHFTEAYQDVVIHMYLNKELRSKLVFGHCV